jgi:hypothetical protein
VASGDAAGQREVADQGAVLALHADQVEAGVQEQAAQSVVGSRSSAGRGGGLRREDPVEAAAPVAVVGRGDQAHAAGTEDAAELAARQVGLGEEVQDTDEEGGVERLRPERERRHLRLVDGEVGAAVLARPDVTARARRLAGSERLGTLNLYSAAGRR